MKKVLIIAYDFNPNSHIGSLRIKGLAKYLPKYGWETFILTTKNSIVDPEFKIICTHYDDVINCWKSRFGLRSGSVKRQLGIKTKKNKKTFADYILNLASEVIAYPDAQKGWYNYAVEAGNEIIEKEGIDAIISSSKPETSHLIAREFRIKYKIPWVADMRDLWTQNHYAEHTIMRKIFERKLEIDVLSKADSLVTVSTDLSERLRKIHRYKKIHSISNGFDPDDMHINNKLTNKFTITYTGSLYSGKRDPSKLFEALEELLPITIRPEDIEIRFYGPEEEWLNQEIEYYSLSKIAYNLGKISRETSLEKQMESQILLLLLWNHPKETGVFTGKIFEYLAAQRPILAIGGPNGVVKDLLEETGAGKYATSATEIKEILKNYYYEYKINRCVNYCGKSEIINNYSQEKMAKKFSDILYKLVNE